jgi:biotin synthase
VLLKMTKREIIDYLKDPRKEKELWKRADEARRTYCGNAVHLRGIIEFSSFCRRNCLYCGLRRDNRKISRYRMDIRQIIRLAGNIDGAGISTVILQSGEDPGSSTEKICGMIRGIKRRYPSLAITLSVGERPLADYRAFKECGADRYLLKHETVNSQLYARLRPGCDLKRRRAILEYLKKTGYAVGAGNIVGLPGQRLDDLAEDILFMKKIGVDMAGIGPFIPHKDTPLKNIPAGDMRLILRVLALARIVLKRVNLPATTALATLDARNGQILGLRAGANVLMPNFTPAIYRKRYTIYGRKKFVSVQEALKTISRAGRFPALDDWGQVRFYSRQG